MIQQRIIIRFFCFIFFLFTYIFLGAQEENTPDITLESPFNTMYVHLHFLQKDSYDPLLAAAAFSGKDSLQNQRHAIQLKQIFDGKGLYVHLNLIPQQSDYLDSVSHKAFFTPFPNQLPEVYLEKIDDKWYYSSETVRKIPGIHKTVYPYGTAALLNWLPTLGQGTFLGLAFWQYVSIGALLLLGWLIYSLLNLFVIPIVRRIAHTRFQAIDEDKQPIKKIGHMISLIITVWFIRLFLPVIQLPIHLAEWVFLGLNIAFTIFVVALLLRILSLVMIYANRYAQGTSQKLDEQILPILRRTLEGLFIVGGIFHVLNLLDVNVAALIAGVSIGGLALALAAQDTVKNLIGSALIFVDRPFQIGDYIEGSGFAGSVAEVGFRTTRIQTLDTSIISVPNGTISNMVVTNLGLRVFRILNLTLGVTYQTSPDKIQQFIEELKQIILQHPNTRKEGYYVYLKGMSASSLDIMFRVYLSVSDYQMELKIKEELLLQILRLAERLEVDFAFPSTTVYLEK